MTTFVLASHNQNKLKELERILAPLHISVSAVQFDEVEETGKTFAQNAYLKAEAACRKTGLPAVADDSGLMVDALNGAPGVYSARYAGANASDMDRIEKLLDALRGVPEQARKAKFVCSICCVFPDGTKITAEGECHGKIAFEPVGNGGFGYDPVFLVDGKSFAQLGAQEKDQISHRGKALRAFAAELEKRKEIYR
ncbi:XTP/dITP diphosphatase [Caproiciproducens galactitolivorans]|uniref:dITP/XTP pyrophosphatase n=1 Tax=Caproiciproducens galactitolivorans TaxID=642589 RepID=A0A4Z0YFK5_9FIRM|nr:XTP/dITP diphosphatase [Caproiciproducens galactitolivorans]QEY34230.1 XTP/dITP diphosphatase [Caproiciproducens galactitolivorans]TGJ78011.1 Non-canonical purine NTP pyrophosphatase [Caproiciproducens galactitolivorans]